MGSIDKACISGFLCRLCSEMHRTVIHIYGDQGKRLGLVEKINGYLPITISPTDPLPKTICTSCLKRVEQHYDLLMRLSKIKKERILYRKQHKRVIYLGITRPECLEEDRNARGSDNSTQAQTLEPTALSTSFLSTLDTDIHLGSNNDRRNHE